MPEKFTLCYPGHLMKVLNWERGVSAPRPLTTRKRRTWLRKLVESICIRWVVPFECFLTQRRKFMSDFKSHWCSNENRNIACGNISWLGKIVMTSKTLVISIMSQYSLWWNSPLSIWRESIIVRDRNLGFYLSSAFNQLYVLDKLHNAFESQFPYP